MDLCYFSLIVSSQHQLIRYLFTDLFYLSKSEIRNLCARRNRRRKMRVNKRMTPDIVLDTQNTTKFSLLIYLSNTSTTLGLLTCQSNASMSINKIDFQPT